MYFISLHQEKEHPRLYELLTTSFFESKQELKDRIEEFSKGVAKPPSESTVKVMLELAISQEQLALALKATPEVTSAVPEVSQQVESRIIVKNYHHLSKYRQTCLNP